jgi:hypothetical protein
MLEFGVLLEGGHCLVRIEIEIDRLAFATRRVQGLDNRPACAVRS